MWGGCGGRGVPKGSRGPVSVCPVCPSPSVSSHRVCPSHLSVCPALCPPIHPSSSALTRSSFIHLSVSPPPPVCPSIHPSVPIHPFVHPSFATPLCPHWCLSPAAHSCCFVTIHIRPFLSVCPVCPSIPMSIYVHLSIHPSLSVHPSHIQPSPSVCLSSRWPSVSPLPAGFPVGRGPLRGSAPAVGIPRLLHSGPWPHLSASAAAAEPSVCLSVPCMDPSVRSSSNKALSPKPSAFASGRWR